MNNIEFLKVVLVSCLLLLICIIQIISNSNKVQSLSKDGVRVDYPFYDQEYKKASFDPKKVFSRKIDWWLFDFADVLNPVLLIICFLIRADFSRLGFNIYWIWLFYFIILCLNRVLFLSKIEFAFLIESSFMSVQAYYIGYLVYLRRIG